MKAMQASKKHFNTIHGLTKSRAFIRWGGMISRCTNPKASSWDRYGAVGISVCKRWRIFRNFFDDMGHPPRGYTLERIDPSGNYTPKNCTWATPKEQARNRVSTVLLTLDGQTHCLTQWAENLGISVQALWRRIHILNWPLQKALTTGKLK